MALKNKENDYLFDEFVAEIRNRGGDIKDIDKLKKAYISRRGMLTPEQAVKMNLSSSGKPSADDRKEKASADWKDKLSQLKETFEDKEKKDTVPQNDDGRAATPERHSAHSETTAASRPNNREQSPAKKKKYLTQEEKFARLIKGRTARMYKILDKEKLFEIFNSTTGGIDWDSLPEGVVKKKSVNRGKSAFQTAARHEKTPKDSVSGKADNGAAGQTASMDEKFHQYCRELLDKGYQIGRRKALAQAFIANGGPLSDEELKPFISRETPQTENSGRGRKLLTVGETAFPQKIQEQAADIVPLKIDEAEVSWAESWIKPLQNWCDEEKGRDGMPKRTLKSEIKSPAEIIVNISPSPELQREKPEDTGTSYVISKDENSGNVNVGMPSQSEYDYFYQIVRDAKLNGIEIIEFKDIKTPQFRDKLLAAALQHGLMLKGAPEKIDFNAPHIQKLPPEARKELLLYNNREKSKEKILQHKEELRQQEERADTEKKPSREESAAEQKQLPEHKPVIKGLLPEHIERVER